MSRSIFGLLLSLYPAWYRQRFGSEMAEVFEDRLREAASPRRRLALLARTVSDLLTSAAAMRGHRPGRRSDRPTPSPKRMTESMQRILQDLRYAFRSLRSAPGFAAAAVITLALGIGANSAVFSLVDAMLLRPMDGVRHPEGLVAMYTADDGAPGVSSIVDFRDFRERATRFASMAAYKPLLMDLATDGPPERLRGLIVTGQYFETLQITPLHGRLLDPSDDIEPGAHPVAVITHGLWRRMFDSDPGAIGRLIRLNGREFEVVGITPPGFIGTDLSSGGAELFAPMMMQPHFMPTSGNLLDRRGWGGVLVLGRVADGANLADARADIESTGAWLRETYPRFNGSREYHLVAFSQSRFTPFVRGTVVQLSWVLTAVVAVVLLIASVNVANLLLARATGRHREIAIRQALGAGRWRVVRQLMAESLLLSLIGGALGLLVAAAATRLYARIPFPFVLDARLDARVLAATFLISAVAALLFGLVPAREATRRDLTTRLRDSGGSGDGPRRYSLGRVLVVAQVALSVLLLVTAGLFLRTLTNLQRVDLGFDPDQVLVATLDPALQGYDGPAYAEFYRAVRQGVLALPGVDAASFTGALPGPDINDTTTFSIQGYDPDDGRPPRAGFTLVGPDYFSVLRMTMVAGREINARDDATAPFAVVVNAAASRQFERLTGRPALGARLSMSGPDGPWAEVIGVTADSVVGNLRDDPSPHLYLPQQQTAQFDMGSRMTLVVRTAGDPMTVLDSVRGVIVGVDPNLPVFDVGTLDRHLGDSLFQERLITTLVGIAAGLAIALAVVGLYGVLAYAVGRRTGEIGVRMALGAAAHDVRRMVLRQGLTVVAIGMVVGGSVAAAATRLAGSMLYGVSPGDPTVFVAVGLLLVAVGLIAAWLPARRATRVDPVAALRGH